ncbi:asparagine synthase-related protein [Sphingomonas sp. BN140010]|uniref:asparagine synthase (glutamine-hydrolyzing) n=1 Tax=Sphingomonas arvum TaxID=2992113 RepID=A0ABT3JDD9_9SPHN|nr:asparagine synthase-related protein [Sphingomonas sp. BN140010]MCW3797082.1 asparagine synthase-related protein [Sphingomonas sp. BN140010]
MAAFAGLLGKGEPSARAGQCLLAADDLQPYGSGQAALISAPGIWLAARPADAILEHGPLLVAADLRLDNRHELTSALGLSHRASDAAVLSTAWLEWGEHVLDRLAGDFAFAVHDRRTRRLTLARDVTGQLPLFYAKVNGGLAFASMPNCLARFGASLRPCLRTMARRLAQVPLADAATVFDSVARVRPGELVTVHDRELRSRIYWNPSTLTDSRGAHHVERYRALIEEAVRSRLRDGPVATHLSSGWDSNAVTATAARLVAPDRLTAFTSGPTADVEEGLPRGRRADETALAALAANHYGIRHEVVRETDDPFETIRRQIALSQTMVLAPFNWSWWAEIRRHAAVLGATTLLTGELGNLTLNAGGLGSIAGYLDAGQWRAWWGEARAAAQTGQVRWRGILINSFGHRLPAPLFGMVTRAFQNTVEPAGSAFVRAEWRQPVPDRRSTGSPATDRLDAIRCEDEGAFRKGAVAAGEPMECDVMADRRLIEFALTLPPDLCLKGGVMRPLARAALADRVPPEILSNPLRGLQGADWFLHFSQARARALLDEVGAVPLARELLDLEAMAAAARHWPTGGWNSGPVYGRYRVGLADALAAGLFLKAYADAGVPAAPISPPLRNAPTSSSASSS